MKIQVSMAPAQNQLLHRLQTVPTPYDFCAKSLPSGGSFIDFISRWLVGGFALACALAPLSPPNRVCVYGEIRTSGLEAYGRHLSESDKRIELFPCGRRQRAANTPNTRQYIIVVEICCSAVFIVRGFTETGNRFSQVSECSASFSQRRALAWRLLRQ
ncbi:MAG: hypothetical protein ACI9R3_003100 [Verrucomicrobiales bacterium]|jgi:hypothetical protein